MKKLIFFLIVCLILVTGAQGRQDWTRPSSDTSGLADKESCIINIQSSKKNIVDWDITDGDSDMVNTHCDFSEKKIFGGTVN